MARSLRLLSSEGCAALPAVSMRAVSFARVAASLTTGEPPRALVGDIVDRLQIRRLLQGFARRVSIPFGPIQLGRHVDHDGFQQRKNGAVFSQIFKRTSADLHGTREVLGNR